MKIGLIDVDGHNFPNLALMKISTYHKKLGNHVEWWNGLIKYDIVYASKVFDFTPDIQEVIQADKVIKGGTGYSIETRLEDIIEMQHPDYLLYGIADTAYGFLTRGCPRNCEFCIVTQKEGCKSLKVANLNNFTTDQKTIKLLDPNITACKEKEDLFKQLINSKAMVDFTQGLDARLITDTDIDLINQMKIKSIHFAWDNYEFKTYDNLKWIRSQLRNRKNNPAVYVLTNFNTTHEQDLERIYKLRELKYDPYIMIFNKESAPIKTRYLQRWVNNRIIFKSVERFEEYDHKRG